MRVERALAILLLSGLVSLPLAAQDWPMWGGTAQRNMTSAMKALPDSWDAKNGTNIKWKAPIGTSSNGNPVVADGKIFLGTNNGNPRNPDISGDKGVLMCLRESDGKFLWQAVTDKLEGDIDWPEEGVCSSAAVEGKRLYYVSNRGELVCLDTEGLMDGTNDGPFQDEVYKGPTDADIIWKLDMRMELGVAQLFMAASAPVVWEDLVFVGTPNGRDSADEKVIAPKAPSFLAVNKATGKVVWQDNSPGEGILHGQWASPALATVDGVHQAIFPGGDGWLYAFNARTGEKLWKFDLNPKDAVWPKTRNYGVATPVFSGGQVFMSVGQDPDHPNGAGRTLAIDPARRGDITESGRVWAVRQDRPVHFDRGGRRRVGLRCRPERRPALPGRQDREALLDLRHAGSGLGVAARGRRQGLPGRSGRRCRRSQGRHGVEEDRRDRHGQLGLQHARARERRALHHDAGGSLRDRRSSDLKALTDVRRARLRVRSAMISKESSR